jgi:hypothetical protein
MLIPSGTKIGRGALDLLENPLGNQVHDYHPFLGANMTSFRVALQDFVVKLTQIFPWESCGLLLWGWGCVAGVFVSLLEFCLNPRSPSDCV